MSCKADLDELSWARSKSSESISPRVRHLPMSNTLTRENIDFDGQKMADLAYLNAALTGDTESIANAFDAAADVNSCHSLQMISGASMNAIQLCVRKIRKDAKKGWSFRRDALTFGYFIMRHRSSSLVGYLHIDP